MTKKSLQLFKLCERYRKAYLQAKTVEAKDAVRQAYFSEKYRIDILEGYWDYIYLGYTTKKVHRNYRDILHMVQMKKIGYTVNQIAENFEVSVWTVRLYLKKYEGKMGLC